eukprot:3641834-Rhodomonas_salina.2
MQEFLRAQAIQHSTQSPSSLRLHLSERNRDQPGEGVWTHFNQRTWLFAGSRRILPSRVGGFDACQGIPLKPSLTGGEEVAEGGSME